MFVYTHMYTIVDLNYKHKPQNIYIFPYSQFYSHMDLKVFLNKKDKQTMLCNLM